MSFNTEGTQPIDIIFGNNYRVEHRGIPDYTIANRRKLVIASAKKGTGKHNTRSISD